MRSIVGDAMPVAGISSRSMSWNIALTLPLKSWRRSTIFW
jgi:hypothetical protein